VWKFLLASVHFIRTICCSLPFIWCGNASAFHTSLLTPHPWAQHQATITPASLKISAGCGLCGFIEDYDNDSFFEDRDNACLKKLTALKICKWPAVETAKRFSKIHPENKNDQQNVDAAPPPPPVEKFLLTTMNIGTSLRKNGTLLMKL